VGDSSEGLRPTGRITPARHPDPGTPKGFGFVGPSDGEDEPADPPVEVNEAKPKAERGRPTSY